LEPEAEVGEPALEPEAGEPVVSTPEPVAPAGLPNWLKKLREEEYEEPAVAEPTMASSVPQVTPEVTVAATAPPEPQPQPDLDLPEDGDERFRLAQTAREEGDVDRAIQIYESLVTSGLNLDSVIADLDLAIRSSPSNYMLHQVKGDAMMKDGRLQGALDAYRQALAKLAS
jgi:tetratricopeptide (TPR) repeat protein